MKTIENIQFLILDLEGNIIFSDDVLFDVEKLPSNCVFDWSPFIESIFPALLKEDHQKMITFEKVKTIHEFLNGSYDYSFYQTEKRDQIIWVISDCSKYYSKLTIQQQYHHQKVLTQQLTNFEKEILPEFQQV